MRIYVICGFFVSVFMLFATPIAVSAQDPDSVLMVDRLIEKVLAQNLQLQSSYEEWRASQTRITQQEALPDPVLGLNIMNLPVNSFSLDQEPMTGKQITLMQMFPFPGKLDIKGEIAETDSEILLQKHRELQNQLVKQARQLYYDLYYVDRALATVADNRGLLHEFVEIAETRYSVGLGLQQDVMRAQVALSKMIDRELKLQQQRDALRARINTLIDESVDTPLGKPVASDREEWTAGLASLIEQADSTSPMLAAWKSVVLRSDQKVNLALKDRYPDFSVGVAYTQRDQLQNGMPGYDFVSAMFNIRIPLYHSRKQDQKVQESRINRTSAEHRYRNVKRTVEQMLLQSLSDLEKNYRLIDLYESGIIPQAEESLESSLAGYQNGKVDFLSLLDSELTLFQFRLDYHRIIADYHKSVAEIQALTGAAY